MAKTSFMDVPIKLEITFRGKYLSFCAHKCAGIVSENLKPREEFLIFDGMKYDKVPFHNIRNEKLICRRCF